MTGGAGNPLAVSVAPTGTHTLQVQATGANTGFATLLGTTAVGTDGIGGRKFFSGTDRSWRSPFRPTSPAHPSAIAAGVAAGGPLDGSHALELAETRASLRPAPTRPTAS